MSHFVFVAGQGEAGLDAGDEAEGLGSPTVGEEKIDLV